MAEFSFTRTGAEIEVLHDKVDAGILGLNELPAYSETEVLTSRRWVDNKPIYRKVIDMGNLPDTDTKVVDAGIVGLGEITEIYGTTITTTGYLPLPYLSPSGGEIKLWFDSGNVNLTTTNDRQLLTGLVVLEYTKAADTSASPVALIGGGFSSSELPPFSETEVLTSRRWTDGKPIYRKVIDFGALPDNDIKKIPHGVVDYEVFTQMYGTSLSGLDVTLPLPHASSTGPASVQLWRDTTDIGVITSNDRTGYTDTQIVLEYTKTTDTSSSPVALIGGAAALTENTTVNFNSGMTSAQIQALIDAQPKNLGTYTLTFQFADGTYTLDTQMNFWHFYNGGLNIYGNASEQSLSGTKLVKLFFTNELGLSLYRLQAGTNVRYLEIRTPGTTDGACVNSVACHTLGIFWSSIYRQNATTGAGLRFDSSSCKIHQVRYGLCTIGVQASSITTIDSGTSDDSGAGNKPHYALWANNSVIMKEGSQPSALSAAETVSNGAVIR